MKKKRVKNWVKVLVYSFLLFFTSVFVIVSASLLYRSLNPEAHKDNLLVSYNSEDNISYKIKTKENSFYSDSDILILDEPTASLDAIAEQEIFKQFDELRKDKLTLFVSHRLSSATTATKIIVLSEGEVVECGTHKELMAKGGHYHSLFTTQAKRYITKDTEEK